MSWEQKTDNLNLTTSGGLYYKLTTSSASKNFNDGKVDFPHNTKLNTWQKVSHTFTRSSSYVSFSEVQEFYIYGNDASNEGTLYVRNVQVEKKDHSTPYTKTDRVLIDFFDDSGYDNNGTIINSDNFVSSSDSKKYTKSTMFTSSSGGVAKLSSPINVNTDCFTLTCWFKPTASSTMALYNHRNSVGDGFSIFYINGNIRVDTGSSCQATFTAKSPVLNTWNFITVIFDKINNAKKCYIDGVSAGDAQYLGTLDQVNSLNFASIGISSNGSAYGDNYLYGYLNDFRIYCTALSESDIMNLYRTGAYIIPETSSLACEQFIEED